MSGKLSGGLLLWKLLLRKNGITRKLQNYKIKDVSIQLEAGDFNKTLGITKEAFTAPVCDNTLVEFFDFIKYTVTIDFGKLNRKNLGMKLPLWNIIVGIHLQKIQFCLNKWIHLATWILFG